MNEPEGPRSPVKEGKSSTGGIERDSALKLGCWTRSLEKGVMKEEERTEKVGYQEQLPRASSTRKYKSARHT